MGFSPVAKVRALVYSSTGVTAGALGLSTAVIVGNPITGLIAGAAAAAAVIGVGEFFPIRAAREREEVTDKLEPEVLSKLPKDLASEFERLNELYRIYSKVDNPLLHEMESIIVNAQTLFQRIHDKLDTQSGRMSAVRYTDTLHKLNQALDPNYYLDILQNPALWDKREERLDAVEKAVTATNNQLIKQIRQVNSSQDIEYSVVLDSLVAADAENALDDLQK